MKRKVVTQGICIILSLLLTSCGRIIDWGKTNFYQADNLDNHSSQVQPFIRSVTMYDQLTTKGHFVALWLTDEVRTAYADLHVFREGRNEERRNQVLHRQLEENSHYLTFYVLSTYEVRLGEDNSAWHMFLQIGNNRYYPEEIKMIELPYEYQLFFGDHWNRFKEPYRVRFIAHDADSASLINSDTELVQLYFRSGNKEHALVWRLKDAPPQPPIIPHPRGLKKKEIPPSAPVQPRKRIRK
jgi:hypothetical protein